MFYSNTHENHSVIAEVLHLLMSAYLCDQRNIYFDMLIIKVNSLIFFTTVELYTVLTNIQKLKLKKKKHF